VSGRYGAAMSTDLIDGFVRLVATGEDFTGSVNLGNPHEISVKELANRIIKLTGSQSRIVYGTLPQDDPTQRCPDITLARGALG
jgi:UDP-glucuronate decarboxylase